MAMLKNQRHELFAQGLAAGKTVTAAQEAAGLELGSCHKVTGYYVYLLVDPRSDQVFYVGKGVRRRAFQHIKEWMKGLVVNAAKFQRIGEIVQSGNEVQARCLQGDMEEDHALDLEQCMISAIGFDRLTNAMPGTGSENARVLASVRDLLDRVRPCRPNEGKDYWFVWHGLCELEKQCVVRHAGL